MDELLVSKENMKIFEQIKALTKDKDKYTMKDVNTICELLGIKMFWYQKLVFLHNLNDKNYMREEKTWVLSETEEKMIDDVVSKIEESF